MRSKLHSYTEAILRQSRFPNEYWSAIKRLRVWGSNDYSFRLQTNRAGYHESCPLFRVLRYRAPSSTICLSEVLKQALRLIARILLIQRKGKCSSREEKGPSRSGFPLLDIRATYVAQTYLPLVCNFYPYAEQQPIAITTKCAVVNKPLL